MMVTKSKKITSIQLERFCKGGATNAFGYHDLRDISEKCNVYINTFAAYDYQSIYIWSKVIYPRLIWILRQNNAVLRLRQVLVQVKTKSHRNGGFSIRFRKVHFIHSIRLYPLGGGA